MNQGKGVRGYCQCGCGGLAPVATYTNRARGVVRGQPVRYIKGHNAKGRKKGNDIQWRDDVGCYAVVMGDHMALIDPGDVGRIRDRTWHVNRKKPGSVYAQSRWPERISMHRLIMEPGPGMVVDHIDGDGMNNRRSNLRVCTVAENSRNRLGPNPDSTSQYIGVHLRADTGKWAAFIKRDGASVAVGTYASEVDAAIARDHAALSEYGDFATLNFPEIRDQEDQICTDQ